MKEIINFKYQKANIHMNPKRFYQVWNVTKNVPVMSGDGKTLGLLPPVPVLSSDHHEVRRMPFKNGSHSTI